MIIAPECYPCFFRQALQTAREAAPRQEDLQRKILQEFSRQLACVPESTPPPVLGGMMHRLAVEVTGRSDLYRSAKAAGLERVMPLRQELEEFVEQSPDPLLAAVAVAIAGNVIDLGANPHYDIDAELAHIATGEAITRHFDRFCHDVGQADSILYILDNLEEAIFDMVLIQRLQSMGSRVIAAVRSAPVFNDITLDDARHIGLDLLCPVIASGSAIPGTDLSNVSPRFSRLYHSPAVVLSKGQGNFETLAGEPRPVWFLFKVKCPVVARLAGFPEGTSVLCPQP